MKLFNQAQGNLIGSDCSANDRAKFLRSIPKPKKQRDRVVAPGVMASKVWNEDVSGSDRRSVKAQLAGRGDLRPLWWKLNVFFHKLFNRSAPMEEVMYSFHKRHHQVTLARIEAGMDHREITNAIVNDGVAGGLKAVAAQVRRKEHRD